MLQLFQNGHADEFFAVWEQFLPSKIRNEDAVAQKLEFYLNIYFAIYPLKHNQKVSCTRCLFFSLSNSFWTLFVNILYLSALHLIDKIRLGNFRMVTGG